MYGTVARVRIKPGMEEKFIEHLSSYERTNVPGFVATYLYRLDARPDDYYLVVIFDSKEAYVANAASPEQDKRYREFRALLEEDPKWHDGEIVHSSS